MLHFAYGANMDRAVMRKYAAAAEPLGVAALHNHRFVITADGYASVERARASTVHGVLWRLTPRDRITLDAWESVGRGHYRAATLPVLRAGARRPALVYVAQPRPIGRPRAGYMELVIAAARAWNLPADYIATLERWLPVQPRGAGHRSLKEFAWT
jgi:AIG2-like family